MENRLFQILLFVLLIAVESSAQGSMSENIKVSLDKFETVDEMPRFPGCEEIFDSYEKERCSRIKLNNYIKVNLDPIDFEDNHTSQEVMAMFIVDKSGLISNIKILRNKDPQIVESARKAIESMNDIRWIPGKKAGKSVNIWYTLPIRFDPRSSISSSRLASKQ